MVNYRNESWKPYKGDDWSEEDDYLISNYGRVLRKKSFQIEEAWELSRTSFVNDYETFWIRKKDKKNTTCAYLHLIVAKVFCEKHDDKKFVVHLDFDKTNNISANLKWVTKSELYIHHNKNPKRIARRGKVTHSKLTEGRVRLIKKKIMDPNRRTRMRLIAKQFGISEMQLYRIKSGENWSHVKID